MYDDETVEIKPPRRGSFADLSMRQVAKEIVDPHEVIATMLSAMRDPSASWRDRLIAAKLLSDRRDGLPVAMVLTASVDEQRLLRDIPTVALDQIEGILRAQLQLAPGEDVPSGASEGVE